MKKRKKEKIHSIESTKEFSATKIQILNNFSTFGIQIYWKNFFYHRNEFFLETINIIG
jgi:hypothetical protein